MNRTSSNVAARVLVAAVACIGLASLAPVAGGQTVDHGVPALEVTGLDRSRYPELTVTGRVSGAPQGCTPADLVVEVWENGALATTATVPAVTSTRSQQLDMVLVTDNSGSATMVDMLIPALQEFVNGLPAVGADYRFGLVRFGQAEAGGAPLLVNDGSMASDLDDFVQNYCSQIINYGSYEPGLLALRTAAESYDFRTEARRILLIITDEDSDGPTTVGEVCAAAAARSATIFANADWPFGAAEQHYVDGGSVTACTAGAACHLGEGYDASMDQILATLRQWEFSVTFFSAAIPDTAEREVRLATSVCGEVLDVTELYPAWVADVGNGPTGEPFLMGAHPNPFNPSTSIRFSLPRPASVSLGVFDVKGRPVRRLVGGMPHDAGPHVITWDGRDDRGRLLGSGVYFCRLSAGRHRGVARVVLLK